MSLPPWRSPLARALHRNRSLPNARYLQLATVDANHHPHNRTVVFRGFHPITHQLQIITDRRREKIEHLHGQPWVELCWYFPKSREQFRLSGTLSVILSETPEQTIRQQLWNAISSKAKAQFYWPSPGQPFDEAETLSVTNDPIQGDEASDTFAQTPDSSRTLSNRSSDSEPPDSFCALLLNATAVDHLTLAADQTRQRFTLEDEGWTVQRINP